jgi:predicted nucleic acid-binding protein
VIYLADTNVMLPFAARAHPSHSVVRIAVRRLHSAGHMLQAASQNFVEFWNVATRPKGRNGLGLAAADADRHLRLAERIFPLLAASRAAYPEWRRLIVAYGVSGVQVHDAHLVAAMRAHRVSHILTFNTSDFTRYAPKGIVAVAPATV